MRSWMRKNMIAIITKPFPWYYLTTYLHKYESEEQIRPKIQYSMNSKWMTKIGNKNNFNIHTSKKYLLVVCQCFQNQWTVSQELHFHSDDIFSALLAPYIVKGRLEKSHHFWEEACQVHKWSTRRGMTFINLDCPEKDVFLKM